MNEPLSLNSESRPSVEYSPGTERIINCIFNSLNARPHII